MYLVIKSEKKKANNTYPLQSPPKGRITNYGRPWTTKVLEDRTRDLSLAKQDT